MYYWANELLSRNLFVYGASFSFIGTDFIVLYARLWAFLQILEVFKSFTTYMKSVKSIVKSGSQHQSNLFKKSNSSLQIFFRQFFVLYMIWNLSSFIYHKALQSISSNILYYFHYSLKYKHTSSCTLKTNKYEQTKKITNLLTFKRILELYFPNKKRRKSNEHEKCKWYKNLMGNTSTIKFMHHLTSLEFRMSFPHTLLLTSVFFCFIFLLLLSNAYHCVRSKQFNKPFYKFIHT